MISNMLPEIEKYLKLCKSINVVHHINELKDWYYMILDIENVFHRIQTYFYDVGLAIKLKYISIQEKLNRINQWRTLY